MHDSSSPDRTPINKTLPPSVTAIFVSLRVPQGAATLSSQGAVAEPFDGGMGGGSSHFWAILIPGVDGVCWAIQTPLLPTLAAKLI